VSAVRDGRSFSIRQVIALQGDNLLLHMMASFHEPTETPLAHAAPMPSVSPPDSFCWALTYAMDAPALEPCTRAVGVAPGDSSVQIASLDHAMWFHWPFRFDDWLFAMLESRAVANGRAYSRGSVFERSGRIVASVAQEGVLRPRA
jgi:acyl-CoA thioesterase